MPTGMKFSRSLQKKQIREVTELALLTNMKEGSAMRSYGRSSYARGASVVPMVLPLAWE
jgi:hypothetical protein